MTNFIICDNCNKLQDKIAVLEKNNQLLSAEVVQRDAVIISLQSSHHSPSDGMVALKQKEQTQRIQLEQKDAIITKLYSDIAKLIQEKEELRQTNHNLARELFDSKSEANNKLNKSNKATNSSIKGNSSDNSNNNDNSEKKRKKPDRSNSRKLCKNLPTIVINHILPKGQDICICWRCVTETATSRHFNYQLNNLDPLFTGSYLKLALLRFPQIFVLPQYIP